MRDVRALLLLCLCLLHAVCHAKPMMKQDDKRARVSTKAILKLESQLKDMAGEDDKPEAHKTTLKVPKTRPVDETEDNIPPVKVNEEKEDDKEGTGEASISDSEATPGVAQEASLPDIKATSAHEEQAVPDPATQQSQDASSAPEGGEGGPSALEGDEGAFSPEEGEQAPLNSQEEQLFDRFVKMADQHPELMDISLEDFEQFVQRLQEKEEEDELDLRAQAAARQGLLPVPAQLQQTGPSPEQRMESFQELNGDHDARVVAKKRVLPPADVLRRRADELQQVAQHAALSAAKRQKETVNVYKKNGEEAARSKRD